MNTEGSNCLNPTIIQKLGQHANNTLYIKREDLLPFSFGGNKARKAMYFLDDIRTTKSDCIVTYGSSSSNHCRIIANIAASMQMKCVIISPEEDENETNNLRMINFFGADVVRTPISQVSQTINQTVDDLKSQGKKPYFIMGGGHGTIGTKAYIDCFLEILNYEQLNDVHFDYIFLASGTGSTQAGLVCGKLIYESDTKIIGISIAREKTYGKQVVLDSVNEYLNKVNKESNISEHVIFIDDYVLNGYGKFNYEIDQTIRNVLISYGIPLNRTYTGKAFWGMERYLNKENIQGKNILFIHTGGTPLFFDYLSETQI